MIEFQFFEGCPNAQETFNNLKSLVNDGFISENELTITEVLDISSAEELNFQGSPTILHDGRDIYTEKKPNSFSYSCRVYTINGINTGALPIEYIKQQIENLRD